MMNGTGGRVMNQSKQMLRQRFYAETDIDVETESHPACWRQYADWLEKAAIKELNHELILDNKMLHGKIQESINILNRAMSGAYLKQRKSQALKKCPKRQG
jgi:hypothetical protein